VIDTVEKMTSIGLKGATIFYAALIPVQKSGAAISNIGQGM